MCAHACFRVCLSVCVGFLECTVCDRVKPESAAALTCNAKKIQLKNSVCLQYSVLLRFVFRFNLIYYNTLSCVFGKGTLSALLLTC